jgi:hypothetical protein
VTESRLTPKGAKRNRPKTIRLKLPVEMVELCKLGNVAPEDILGGYMKDLLRLPDSHGSDERNKASDYFLRMIWHYTDINEKIEDFVLTDRRTPRAGMNWIK